MKTFREYLAEAKVEKEVDLNEGDHSLKVVKNPTELQSSVAKDIIKALSSGTAKLDKIYSATSAHFSDSIILYIDVLWDTEYYIDRYRLENLIKVNGYAGIIPIAKGKIRVYIHIR